MSVENQGLSVSEILQVCICLLLLLYSVNANLDLFHFSPTALLLSRFLSQSLQSSDLMETIQLCVSFYYQQFSFSPSLAYYQNLQVSNQYVSICCITQKEHSVPSPSNM